MIRRPPRSTHCISSAASDVYKRQPFLVLSQQIRNNYYSPDIFIADTKVKENVKTLMNFSPNQQLLEDSDMFSSNKKKHTVNKNLAGISLNGKQAEAAQNAIKTIRAPLKGLHRRIRSQDLENSRLGKREVRV
eukprot:TRINITY_DN15897_c0_g1_i2.p1 TRINITY_DN15897_c0_g1~~TRINITY_DN15897_c0_g1_i2.p1  ORF type:complete len:140 (+),score=36.28 TRINITY_DN15897_c0_g1_i2:22-420(+)